MQIAPDLSLQECMRLAGWVHASGRFVVRSTETGVINPKAASVLFVLESRLTTIIGAARWQNLIINDEREQTWDDFLALYDRAEFCAGKQQWLIEWKQLDHVRQIELNVISTEGFSDAVMPAWEHAGFPGHPEFKLRMRQGQEAVGTIYISSHLPGALITAAHRDGEAKKDRVPHHWFDDLEFSFHPRAEQPTYGRVNGDGQVEIRTMPRTTSRRR
jgi:hypothetical protein